MLVELQNVHCIKQSAAADSRKRLLDELDVLDHIHGRLTLQPDEGPPLHSFGYWDANDACLGQWLSVFNQITSLADARGNFAYEFPYPDQGDPRLEFVFSDKIVTIRTTFYTDDLWSQVEDVSESTVSRNEFEACIRRALQLIESTVLQGNPNIGPAWLERNKRE